MFLHAALAVGTCLPILLIYLIATDVNILKRKEIEGFRPHVFAELNHLILTRAERSGKEFAPSCLWKAGQPVIVGDGGEAVSGHIYLRKNVYASYFGIVDDVLNILLCVEATV